jgi:hypothetical protein
MTIRRVLAGAGGVAAAVFLSIGLGAAPQRAATPQQGTTPTPQRGAAPAPQRGAAPPRGQTPPAPARGAAGYTGPRTPDGKPDLNGIWQIISTAHWNLEAHSASEGVPAGFSVVEGGAIPYKPEALAKRNENFKNRMQDDPLRRCFMAGVPRSMYLPFPFEITQMPKHILMAFEFAHATRTVFLDGTPHLEDLDFWMGDARGKWEGDTLVIDTVSLGAPTWFDQAGNYHSELLKVTERITPIDATHLNYEATIEDAKVFTRPWKINLIGYKRLERNLEVLEYECVEHVYEKVFKDKPVKWP